MIDIAHVNCSRDESVIFNDKIWTIQTTNISKQVISESMICDCKPISAETITIRYGVVDLWNQFLQRMSCHHVAPMHAFSGDIRCRQVILFEINFPSSLNSACGNQIPLSPLIKVSLHWIWLHVNIFHQHIFLRFWQWLNGAAIPFFQN